MRRHKHPTFNNHSCYNHRKTNQNMIFKALKFALLLLAGLQVVDGLPGNPSNVGGLDAPCRSLNLAGLSS